MSAKDWGVVSPDDNAPTRTLTDINRPDYAEQDMLEAEAQSSGIVEATQEAFTSGGNVAYQGWRMYEEITQSGPIDPAWETGVERFIESNRIDPSAQWRFRATGNETEANMLLARMQENARGRDFLAMRGGIGTFVAEMAAGLIDIDAPLAFATGGLSSVAKAGYAASKAGRMTAGALVGTASSGLIAAGSVAVNPNDDWSILPAMLLTGTALGSLGGLISGGARSVDALSDRANTAMQAVHEDVGQGLAAGMPASRRPAAVNVDDVDPWGSRAYREAEASLDPAPEAARAPRSFVPEEVGAGDSAGAARAPNTGDYSINTVQAERHRLIIENARQRDKDLGLDKQFDDMVAPRNYSGQNSAAQNANTFLYNSAVKFSQLIARSPASNDFNRILRTDTSTGRVFAYDLFESPLGIYRNNDNAARYFNDYKTQMLSQLDETPDLYYAWARANRSMNQATATMSQKTQEEFNREVIQELMNRFYGRSSNRGPNDPIGKAADAYDRMYGRSADIERGRPGQGSVEGADNLQPKSGYIPQSWSGAKMRKLVEAGRDKKDIAQAIYEAYRTNYSNKIKDEDLKIYSRAVVDRFLMKTDGTSVSINSWINADGRAAVEAFLSRQTGISQARAKSIIDGLTGDRRIRGRAGYLKERLDVDFSFKASNGIDMFDLLDTDLRGMAERRAHRSAGQAALARKGIKSRTDYEAIVDAVVEEQKLYRQPTPASNPGDRLRDWYNNPKHMDREDLMEMYNYFIGAPLYGGVSPMYAMAKKLTNLSLLNQLGMAQMAEWGTNMAAVGVRDFMRKLPDSVKASMRKHDSPLMQEMRQLGVYFPDDRLHRFDQTYSTEKINSDDAAWLAKFNGYLNAGARLQGFTSLFYTMNRAQHHMAVDIAITNMMKHFNGLKPMSDARFRDAVGDLDKGMQTRLKHYAENVVTYDGNGDVVTLNLSQWQVDDVEALSRYINANTRQQVQRALIGESNTQFHKDGFVGLFWHLKSFPLLALEKQFARNAAIGDPQAMGSFMYGLGWAALAYSTKQVLSGNTDNLEYDKIARGAFNMSNMTGWLPMWADPALSMFGLGDYGLSGYNGRGGTSIISIPAVFPTLDKMLQIPGALIGETDTSAIRAIQSLPIVGNAYGMSALMNASRDRIRTENQASRREQVQEAENNIVENALEGTNIPTP